jgi:hypothetical protein
MGPFDRGKRYLYLYNPDSPGQVRNIRETQTFRKKIPETPLPLSPVSRFARNLILDRFGRLYM